ncbi:MAG TPA: glycosyltransferase [Gammaproteobacteria bacterium]
MRFTVVTYGTEGDTRPIVALCRGLIAIGHSVHLFADRSTLSTAKLLGVAATPLAGDMREAADPDAALSRLMKDGGGVQRMTRAVARIANANTAAWMECVLKDARSSDAILFSGIASYIGLSVGECLNIPAIGLGLWPISPTREFASPLLRPWRMPGWLNLASHHAVNRLLWRHFRRSLNEARRKIASQPNRRAMWRRYPVMYGVSRYLVPQPKDWPAEWQICGAWRIPEGLWTPQDDLAEFIADGPPPIYIGFGSMGGFDKGRLLAVVIDAVAGRRAIFYPGWSGIVSTELPSNFFTVGETSHAWLFPRMSMVIHHGGAGTSHSAAQAGVPSIVIPFAGDQFFWAHRLACAGIAPAYVEHTRIDAAVLADAISYAERDDVRDRAKKLAAVISQEDGVRNAVEGIARVLEEA